MLVRAVFEGDTAPMASEDTPAPGLQPRYVKLDEVAAYLSVSVPQVYALVRSGELPAIKIGGRGVWRVDRTKLDVWLEKLEAETAAWTKTHPLGPKDDDIGEQEPP